MKRFVRLAAVQSTLAFLVTVYVRLVSATTRWRVEPADAVAEAMAVSDGAILFFWHGRIALGVACRELLKGLPIRVLISLSPDGEFIAKAAQRLGFPAIRGSTARRPGQQGKGGAAAFAQALDYIATGGGVIITPDGPRGPAEVMQAGSVVLAKRAGTRVFLAGIAARPALQLKSWDRAQIPLPFSRGCVVFEGPLHASTDTDRNEVEAVRADWEARLHALDARARAMLDEARP